MLLVVSKDSVDSMAAIQDVAIRVDEKSNRDMQKNFFLFCFNIFA